MAPLIKPMMNFAMQLKYLPKGINKQQFIDKTLGVDKIAAYRAAEDIGYLDFMRAESRGKIYEVFENVDFSLLWKN